MIRRDEWVKEYVEPSLQKRPERKEKFTNTSGIEIERCYFPADSLEEKAEKLGFPGVYPFTRGVQATGYRAQLWTRRPITGFQSASDTNKRFKELMARGQTGLHFVFDYPTLACIGSDDPLAKGEIGLVGIPMNSLQDMEQLLDGIDLDKISTSWSHWGPSVFAMLVALVDNKQLPRSVIAGTLQNDVLMYFHSCPWFDLPLKANMKLFVDVVEFAVKHMPKWNVVGISGYNIREGGCSAVEEIAFTFGDAIAYAEACIERGLDPDDFLKRFSFHLCAHNDFFEEICKMRAMRRMWAKITKERLGAKKPESMKLRFHTQTAGSGLTAQQPLNNIIRGTIHGLIAVLGGTQSLHVSCYDEAYGTPTAEAAKLSVNVQNIIAGESNVDATIDPLGGSYYVEKLTDQLEEKAWEIIAEIDRQGGMVEAALNGWVQERKNEYQKNLLQKIEDKEQVIVGLNAYQDTYTPVDGQLIEERDKEVLEDLERLKAGRDNAGVKKALNNLRQVCDSGENVVEATIEAVKSYATLSEIYQVYRETFGSMNHDEMLASIGLTDRGC